MARFSLVIFLVLAACGNAVSPSIPDDPNATALLPSQASPSAEVSADAGEPPQPVGVGSTDALDAGPGGGATAVPDAGSGGPAAGLLGGTVDVPGGLPAPGATVTLTPAGVSTTTDQNGSYNFDAVPEGPFTVTATLPGYQPGTLWGTMAAGGTLTESAILLERSTALFAPDSGFRPTWMAFAPDGGPLYAADQGSMWRLPEDGGAIPLITGDPTVEPLGFGSDGTPIYLAGYQPAVGGGLGSAAVELGPGVGLPIELAAPGPYLIGDDVYFAGATMPDPGFAVLQPWSVVSAKSPTPAVAVPEALASPAVQPAAFGLVGYRPAMDFFAICAQAFPTASVSSDVLCPSQWPMPTAIGVSPDGALAALEFSTSASFVLPNDSWQVTVVTAGSDTPLSQHPSATQYAQLLSLVPLSSSSAAEIFDDGSLVWDTTWGSVAAQGTEVAALPDGSALFLDDGALYLESATFAATSAPIAYAGSWAPPVVSPNGAYAVFPGVPMVVGVQPAKTALVSQPLAETPRTAQFSPNGSTLLIVAEDGSLHVVTFTGGGLADVELEGTATLAQLTPDGQSVVYAGTAPDGRVGIFEQPASP